MSGATHLETELLKMEQGAVSKKWSKKLVVVDGDKGTIRYHRSKDDRWSQPRKIFQLSQLILDTKAQGPKKAPHAFELRHRTTGYSMVLACDRGKAEHRAWCQVLTPLVHSLKSFHSTEPEAVSQDNGNQGNDDFPSPLTDDDVHNHIQDNTREPALRVEEESHNSSARTAALAELRVGFPRESEAAIAIAYENEGSVEAARAKLRTTEALRRKFPHHNEATLQSALNNARGDLERAIHLLGGEEAEDKIKTPQPIQHNNATEEPRPLNNGIQHMATPTTRSSPAGSFSSSVHSREKPIDTIFYAGEPLGIQLRLTPATTDGSRDVVILAVKPTCPARDRLRAGDLLYAADNEPIPAVTSKHQFGELTKKLARHPRPLKLRFIRKVKHTTSKHITPERPLPHGSKTIDSPEEHGRMQSAEDHDIYKSRPERKPSFVSDITEDPPLDVASTTWETIAAASGTTKSLQNKNSQPIVHLNLARRHFDIEFEDFPLGFKLVLAQYRRNRLAIQLNEVAPTCAHFREIQVLDELLAVDGNDSFSKPSVKSDSFDIATTLLASAVRAKKIPLHLRFARKAAVFSVDFPKRPLGIQLRLTTVDKRKAIIVKHHDSDENDNNKPRFLVPGDDHLIAVHGALLPRQCDNNEFNSLMQRLQAHDDWPLRLTFWRRSLGSLDDFGHDDNVDGTEEVKEGIIEKAPEETPRQLSPAEASDEDDDSEPRPLPEKDTAEEEFVVPQQAEGVVADDDDSDEEEEEEEEEVKEEEPSEAESEPDQEDEPEVPAELPEANTMVREFVEEAYSPDALAQQRASKAFDEVEPVEEPKEPEVAPWRASEVSEQDTSGLIKYRAASTALGGAAITAMRRVDSLKNKVIITEEEKAEPEKEDEEAEAVAIAAMRLPQEDETEEEESVAERSIRPKTAPARMSKLAYFLETGQMPTDDEEEDEEDDEEENVIEPEKVEPDTRDQKTRHSLPTVEIRARELEERIEKEHPAYKPVSTSSEHRNEAQEIIEAVVEENQSSLTESAKRKLTTSRPKISSRNISDEEHPAVGTHERLSALFGSTRSLSFRDDDTPNDKNKDDDDDENEEVAPIADSSMFLSSGGEEEATSSIMVGSPESERQNRNAELEEELEAVRAELRRTSYELVQTRRALDEERALAVERVQAAEAAAEARVAHAKDELTKAHEEAQRRLELFEEALRRANPSNWYTAADYEKAKAEADAARQEAETARAELEDARLREESAVRAAREDVADAKRQLQDKEDQAAAVETASEESDDGTQIEDDAAVEEEDELVDEFVEKFKNEEGEPGSEDVEDTEALHHAEVPALEMEKAFAEHQHVDEIHDDSSEVSSAVDEAAMQALGTPKEAVLQLEEELAAARAEELERIEAARLELERELAEAKQNALQSMENELQREKRELNEAKRRELDELKAELQAETKRELDQLREQAKAALNQIEEDSLKAASPVIINSKEYSPRVTTEVCNEIAALYFDSKLRGVDLAREAMRATHTLARPPTRAELVQACLQRPEATGNTEWCGRREVGATLIALAAVDDDESGGWVSVLDEIVCYCDEIVNFGSTANGESILVAYFDHLWREEMIPREAFEAWRGRSVDHLATTKHQRRPAAALAQTDNWFAAVFADDLTPIASENRQRRRSLRRNSSPVILIDSVKSRSLGSAFNNNGSISDEDEDIQAVDINEDSIPAASESSRRRQHSELADTAALVAEAIDAGPFDETTSRLEALLDTVDIAGFRAWRALALVEAESGKTPQRQAKARAQLLAAQPFLEAQGLDDSLDQRLAAERSRVDAEMARRLSDERHFFEKRLNESLSPGQAVDDPSSRLEERTARLEQRIADAEKRVAQSQDKSNDFEQVKETTNSINTALLSPKPRKDPLLSPAASLSSSSAATSSRRKRPTPLGLPSAAQPLLRERFLSLLCTPRGPLLDSPQCALRVSVDLSGIDSDTSCLCKVRVQNISSFTAHELKIQVFSDDAHYNGTTERLGIVALGNATSVKNDLEPNRYRDLEVSAQCKAPFVVPPEMTLRFELDGRRHAYALRLPIAATTFAKPDPTSAKSIDAFSSKWEIAADSNHHEQQLVVSSRSAIDDSLLHDVKHRILRTACKASLVPNPASKFTLAAAAFIYCHEAPFKVPVLMRLEANAPAKAFRITVRSPSQDAAAATRNILQALITSYFIM